MLPRKCLLVCALNVLCVFVALAQNKDNDIEGYIKDVEGHSIVSASVYLLKAADSAVVKFAISDERGFFKFNNIGPGTYLINVTGTGYQSNTLFKVFLNGSRDIDIGTMHLSMSNEKLHEIAVKEEKSLIEVRPDKTILNIRNSNLMVGNNALEVLTKSPGVQVNGNDEISLYGRSGILVMIDNKPTYLSGIALNDLLRGIQSSMIDKIELISNPNSTYDAEGTGGVINIIMVRDKNVGTNAQLTGGAGIAQFPGGAYSGARGNAGVNFNYRTTRLNVFGGYSYSNTPAYKSIVTQRLDVFNGPNDMINVSQFINQRRETNNLRIGADFDITPAQTIGFVINDVITSQHGPKGTTSFINNNHGIDSSILTNSLLKRMQSNISYNLNYQANVNKSGVLTLNADYIRYKRQYDEYFQSNYFYNYNVAPYRDLSLQNNSPLNYNVYVFSGSYHFDINSDNNFTAGFKSGKTNMDNNSSFGSVAGDVYTAYPDFTGRFDYSERINALYADYSHIFNKNNSIELGARLEQTVSESITSNTGEDYKNNYFGFFPDVKLNHIINGDNQLQLSYGRRVYRPKYEELNPLLLYSDQYTYQIGNQYLMPYYSNLLEFKHIYKDKFTTALSFEAVSGFSQVVYLQNDQSQVSTLMKVNLGNRYNYGIHFIAPVTFTPWYNVDFDLNMLYQQYTGTSLSGDLDSGSPDVTLKIYQHFKLPLNTQLDLGGFYETPTTYGIYRYKAEYYAYGGISKSVLKKQGTIHLQVDGMFNSDKNIYTSHYQNLNLSGTQINNFRTITLSFTYSLGSKTIKAAAKKDNDADEEQGRMTPGTN